jgi:hypothetical protein
MTELVMTDPVPPRFLSTNALVHSPNASSRSAKRDVSCGSMSMHARTVADRQSTRNASECAPLSPTCEKKSVPLSSAPLVVSTSPLKKSRLHERVLAGGRRTEESVCAPQAYNFFPTCPNLDVGRPFEAMLETATTGADSQ